jgi:hypothetical protein
MKYLWVGGSFNRYHLAGWVLAALAVILINKGNLAAH